MTATSKWTLRTPRTASLLALLALAGCAHPPPSATADKPTCAALFAARDAVVQGAGDAQYQPLAGLPGLRSDRLLAALAGTATRPDARRLWLQELAARDAEASAIELGNLPASQAAQWTSASRQQALALCRQAQIERLLVDPLAFQHAAAAAQVPDDYRPWARRLGAYGLFEPFYRRGVQAWQRAASATEAPAEAARWLTYTPLAPPAPVPPPVTALNVDALGLPRPSAEQADALFARHAPTLRIEQRSRADRLGSPAFDTRGRRVFQQTPRVYQHLGWSWLDGRWRLQLIYQLWFARRPDTHPLDLYAGKLDGLLWRVTLNERGEALLYDSIHPCGCWHGFYLPVHSPLQLRPEADQESRLARRLTLEGRTGATLWLASGDHRLSWVDDRASAFPAIGYARSPLDGLRQLPHPQGRRSLYGPDGLVPGSERLERWLLWPSGVDSPGTMRQWGRHATAFIGRAQFDAPYLLQDYFPDP
ncbi:MAG: hypothetical protein ABWY06_22375 [Pseudomonas sp.]|uniref:hypothetical protein n=1 Tax=Pseudomonas sp. TaxID=306 RepID=UPI00339AC831